MKITCRTKAEGRAAPRPGWGLPRLVATEICSRSMSPGHSDFWRSLAPFGALLALLALAAVGCRAAEEAPGPTGLDIQAEAPLVNEEILAIEEKIRARRANQYFDFHRGIYRIWAEGTAAEVRQALRAGARPNGWEPQATDMAKYNYTSPPLVIAVRENPDPEVARALLEAGADPNLGDANLNRPLHFAVNRLDSAMVGLLLEAGADPQARARRGNTALHYAMYALSGSIKHRANVLKADDFACLEHTVALLLDLGLDPDQADKAGYAPLHVLAWSAQVPDRQAADRLRPTLKLLIDRGADINRRAQGDTPIMRVGRRTLNQQGAFSRPLLRLMIEQGADLNVRGSDRLTLLMMCAEIYSDIRLPLEKEPIFYSLSSRYFIVGQDSSFYINQVRPRIETFTLLLEAGADPEIEGKKGRRALDRLTPEVRLLIHDSPLGNRLGPQFEGFFGLCAYGRPEQVREALERRRKLVKAVDKGYFEAPPLSIAVFHNPDPAVAAVLLEKGADPNQRNKAGLRPLHFAAAALNAGAVKLLLEAGAEVGAPDRYGPINRLTAQGGGQGAHPVGILILLAINLVIPDQEYHQFSPLEYAAGGARARPGQTAAYQRTVTLLEEAAAKEKAGLETQPAEK